MRKSHRISGLNFETRRAALICYGLAFLSGMCTNCEKTLNLQIQVDESDVVMDFSSFHIVSVELNIDTTCMGAVGNEKNKLSASRDLLLSSRSRAVKVHILFYN